MAPDSLHGRLGEQPLHLVFKFLAYEVILHDSYDQNLLKLRQGLVGENPTVNYFCAGSQRESGQAK
ncbi:MAG TPA: hypothetical protein VJP02_16285 [Candidatus Sulfotelmatobacter sp.]|nr:hypothetical protein [Candidatus Sulfotelmatobacter sp.]